jgi:uncharacterized protein (DUF427 family)
MSREMKLPSEEHPITVEATGAPVTVQVNGRIIARTNDALTLQEASYPAVQYVPLADVDPKAIVATDAHTYCPFKGEASYYTIKFDDVELTDAIWSYQQPYPAVAEIAGHVAFYPDKAEITVG